MVHLPQGESIKNLSCLDLRFGLDSLEAGDGSRLVSSCGRCEKAGVLIEFFFFF